MTVLTVTMTPLPPVEQRCRLRSALADTFRRETGSDQEIGVDIVEPRASDPNTLVIDTTHARMVPIPNSGAVVTYEALNR